MDREGLPIQDFHSNPSVGIRWLFQDLRRYPLKILDDEYKNLLYFYISSHISVSNDKMMLYKFKLFMQTDIEEIDLKNKTLENCLTDPLTL